MKYMKYKEYHLLNNYSWILIYCSNINSSIFLKKIKIMDIK